MYLTYRWNIPYQYELNRLGDFKYLDLGSLFQWDYSIRPMDTDARQQKLESIDLSNYEAMVIHFDEDLSSPEGLIPALEMLQLSIRKVLVCHGAPPLLGRLDPNNYLTEEAKVDEDALAHIKKLVGSTLVVHPNKVVQKMWGFSESVVIEPTLSSHHFPYIHKTVGRAITVSPTPSILPLRSGYHLMRQSCTALDFCDLMGYEPTGFIRSIRMPSLEESSPGQQSVAVEDLARRRFYDYMNLLGSYTCYFNTGFRNPWDTAMHEAMLLGTAVVTTNYFGESEYIKNGYDGFIANDAMEMRNAIIFLSKNFDTAVAVGQRARERALKRARSSQFQDKWKKLLRDL